MKCPHLDVLIKGTKSVRNVHN